MILFCCSPTWRTCPVTSTCRASAWASPSVPTTRLTTPLLCGWRRATQAPYPLCTRELTRSSQKRTPWSLGLTCITWRQVGESFPSNGLWNMIRNGWTVSCWFIYKVAAIIVPICSFHFIWRGHLVGYAEGTFEPSVNTFPPHHDTSILHKINDNGQCRNTLSM